MSINFMPGNYDGHSRPVCVLRRYRAGGEERLWALEWLCLSAREWVGLALSLFLAGAVLGAGMLMGACMLYKAVTP